MSTFPQQGSASIEINDAPEAVGILVSDITRMAQWSPECFRAQWTDGATAAVVGAHFQGFNRLGTTEWDTTCGVTECEPGKTFAFTAPYDSPHATRWRFEFAPSATGTSVTQSFDAPLINVEGSVANVEGRCEMLVEGMKTTLANLKAAAEATP